MKKRNALYFKMSKARKVIGSPMSVDLSTFLSAAMQLTRNNVVRRHIEESLLELGHTFKHTTQYKMSA